MSVISFLSLLLRVYSWILQHEKITILNYSVNEFLKGEYDSITEGYYRILDSLLKGTPYEKGFTALNTQRDIGITRNALEMVRNNPGKQLLILVGANHRNRLVDSLQALKNVKLLGSVEE